MRPFTLFTFLFYTLLFSAQEEDPIKILSYTTQRQLNTYMEKHHWHLQKKHAHENDSIDGGYLLYKKKTFGHGNMYMAVHLNKYCHYQVFWSKHEPYSEVMTYSDFLLVSKGKTRYTQSISNEKYALKTVILEDYHDTKNKNVLFGILPTKNINKELITNEKLNIHSQAGVEIDHFEEENTQDIKKEVHKEEKQLKKEDKTEHKLDKKTKEKDLEIRDQELYEKLEKAN